MQNILTVWAWSRVYNLCSHCLSLPVHACLEITFSKLLKSELLRIPGDLTLNPFRNSRRLRNITAQKLGSAQPWAYRAPWSDLMAQRCPQRDQGTAGKQCNAEEHWLAGPCAAPQCSGSAGRAARRLGFEPCTLTGEKQRSSPRGCSPGACSPPCQAAVPALAFTIC